MPRLREPSEALFRGRRQPGKATRSLCLLSLRLPSRPPGVSAAEVAQVSRASAAASQSLPELLRLEGAASYRPDWRGKLVLMLLIRHPHHQNANDSSAGVVMDRDSPYQSVCSQACSFSPRCEGSSSIALLLLLSRWPSLLRLSFLSLTTR